MPLPWASLLNVPTSLLMFAPEMLRETQGWPGGSWSPYHTGQDPLPNTPHHTPDLRNAWYYIHHVVLGKSVWKFWQPESKRPSTAAMFNTNHPEALLRAYHTLTHICINRVSMPPNWLSPLRPHFYCLSLFPIGSCPLIQNVYTGSLIPAVPNS